MAKTVRWAMRPYVLAATASITKSTDAGIIYEVYEGTKVKRAETNQITIYTIQKIMVNKR
jgi:hypothetical protein